MTKPSEDPRNGTGHTPRGNGRARLASPISRDEGARMKDPVSAILNSALMRRLAEERAGLAEATGLDANGTVPPGSENEFSMDQQTSSVVAEAPVEVSTGDETSGVIPLWKRLFDCALILLVSPLWLPVMLLITIGIKLSSPGPVFYRQERIGYRGRRFMISKFRTMKVNVETHMHESHFEQLMAADCPMTKLDAKGDPRLIGCGRFLRAAGLDELPQLFNILRGEMSLVGPRPCTVHEFARYQPWQRERINAPPGLTGYWQVNGKNKTTFSEMIAMDIFYGKNMSLGLDLTILAKTVPAVFVQLLESRTATAWRAAMKKDFHPSSLSNDLKA